MFFENKINSTDTVNHKFYFLEFAVDRIFFMMTGGEAATQWALNSPFAGSSPAPSTKKDVNK